MMTMNRKLIHFALAALLLACALPAAAAMGTWTAVASTGVVDESATGIYSFGSTNLTYLGGSASVAPIVARYNVTKTWSSSDTPPWTTLELGYFDSSPLSTVRADLFQVDRCTGKQTLLCTFTSVDFTASTCGSCTFAPTVNFANNLYYVQVTLSRTSATVVPQALTLRIF
jgi:hypothetical protein